MYPNAHEGEKAPDIGSLDVQGLYYPEKYVFDAEAQTVSCPECGG